MLKPKNPQIKYSTVKILARIDRMLDLTDEKFLKNVKSVLIL